MKKTALVSWFLLLAAIASGQARPVWPCSDELMKSEGDNHRVRVSTDVSAGFEEKKILPAVSDLKGVKIDSTVVVRMLIDKTGAVRCADAVEGDASLLQRTQEAALQWHFKPYLLNGQPVIVETSREFIFKKNKVTAR
jgi:hypothetical protein